MDKQLIAHELWAAAQLAPGEGIEDGANRIATILERIDAERGKSAAGILCISQFRGCPEMENMEFQPLRSFAPGQYPLFLSPTPAIPEGMAQDAKRFAFLQNLAPEKAQAFFWNYTSRRQRAKAIDEAMIAAAQGERK